MVAVINELGTVLKLENEHRQIAFGNKDKTNLLHSNDSFTALPN